MKKILFVALAAATMMSCTENEVVENAGNKAAIEFGTAVNAGTRAAVVNNSNFNAFTVSAYTVEASKITTDGLGTAYMNKVDYTGGKGSWTAVDNTTTYYWPINEKMQFFAYPTSLKDKFTVGSTGYPSLNFTVAATAADQTDLVVAQAADVTKPADNKLTLTFKHPLTRINFSYKPEDASYTYTISKITINAVSGGTATYTFNGNNGSWGVGSTASTNYDYPIAATPVLNGDYYTLGESTASLMLLPQDVAGKTISVTYKTVKDGHTYFDNVKTVTLPAGAEWEMGQNIRYKLTLPVGADAIILDTDVEDPAESGSEVTPDATPA